MRGTARARSDSLSLMWLAILLLTLVCAVDTTDDRQAELQDAITDYIEPLGLRWDASTVRVGWTDLNGDGMEDALVALTGRDWCGSGGCTLLVFEAMNAIDAQEMGAFRPTAEISLVRGPIRVVPGWGYWCDLIVESGNGPRVLRFDGETYPPSPSDGDVLRGPMPAGTTLFADGP